MAFFDWKEEFSVNIREIDIQHQKLVAMLNSLYESLKKGEGLEALGSTLSELVSYTKTHFATEERLMKTNAYPGYLSHKEKHEKMTNRVLEYTKKYDVHENLEAYIDHMSLFTFFEGIGVLVKKGLIDVELVEDLFSRRIIWFWDNCMEPRINGIRRVDRFRQSTNDPTQYDSWEYLYNLMRQREQQATVST